MTTKIPCYVEFSDDGHFARLVHKSKMIIAEFLIYDSNLVNRALDAHDRLGLMPNIVRPTTIYRGEVYEILPSETISNLIEMLELNVEIDSLIETKEDKHNETK